jgi:hypothetical protein
MLEPDSEPRAADGFLLGRCINQRAFCTPLEMGGLQGGNRSPWRDEERAQGRSIFLSKPGLISDNSRTCDILTLRTTLARKCLVF